MERELREQLDSILSEDENLLWSGSPEPGLHFQYGDKLMIPFTLVWCSFAIFWEASVLASGDSSFVIFGAIFVAVGLYAVFGRYVHAAWMASRTLYGVTNKRVIFIEGRKVRSILYTQIPCLEKHVKKNGLGHIVMDDTPVIDFGPRVRGPFRRKNRNLGPTNIFQNIRDVEEVYRLISNRTMYVK